MKNYTLPILLLSFIVSACFDTSSTALPSTSQQSSIVSSMTSTPLSSNIVTSSSTDSSTTSSISDVASTGTSASSEARLDGGVNLASKWFLVMGGINATSHYSVPLTLSTDLTNKKLTEINLIYESGTNQFYGVGYEALVNGIAGTIRFRIGIRNNAFTGFECLNSDHREHTAFGVKIINALRSNLAGREATVASALAALAQATVGRTGQSRTYDGIMPAIEVMVLHYSSEIA